MLRTPTIGVEPIVKTMLEEMIFVFTHGQNEQFKSFFKANSEITRVVYLNDNKEFNHSKKTALNLLLNTFRAAITETPARLITFAIDFNLGYSGDNISLINEIIATLETESELAFFKNLYLDEEEHEPINNFVYINTQEKLAVAKNAGEIPFRFVTTGSGGASVADNYHGFENLTSAEATAKYSFEGMILLKFLAAMRKINGSTPLPSASPLSASRRLREQKTPQRNTSTASTEPNGSPPSTSTYEYSPSSRASTFSTSAPGNTPLNAPSPVQLFNPTELGRANSENGQTTADQIAPADNSALAFRSFYSPPLIPRLQFFPEASFDLSVTAIVPTVASAQEKESTTPPNSGRKRPSPIKTPERKPKESATEEVTLTAFRKLKF